jgi:hypothetical protein
MKRKQAIHGRTTTWTAACALDPRKLCTVRTGASSVAEAIEITVDRIRTCRPLSKVANELSGEGLCRKR